jgi:hypothetical protein
MKITTEKKEPTFEPIELTIRIDNQEEYDTMTRIATLDITIPNAVPEDYRGLAKKFVVELRQALNSL